MPGDFFTYVDLLSDEDKAILAKVRAFLVERVASIAETAGNAPEVPYHLIPEIAALDILGLDTPRSSAGPPPTWAPSSDQRKPLTCS